MLAAGMGIRLGEEGLPPKILLRFGGQSLLARHIAILRHCGIRRLDLVVGYRAEEIEAEIARIGAEDLVFTIHNPDYHEGPIVSFAHLHDTFTSGDPVVFMDADVLYDHRMLERLLAAPQENCFLLDRATEEGEDPVRLCIRDGVLVDIHKRPQRAYDWWGEWVGFCRFDPRTAARIAAAARRQVEAGHRDEFYEDAIQEILLAEPPGKFETIDISDLPWVEIDFPEDLEKARSEIFARLHVLPDVE
jgi:choline kinase